MDDDFLPAGTSALLKVATRELIAACGGAAVAVAATGLSKGQISRCQGEGYPDVLPLWAALILEMRCGRPVMARLLASLTGHEVVTVDAGGDGDGSHVGDLVEVARTGAAVTTEMGVALADGVVTGREADVVQAAISRHQQSLDRTRARLALVKVGGGR